MNTKATAPAAANTANKPANAPTVKDESKATHAATGRTVKFVPLSAEEKKEYIDLKNRFDHLDDVELDRLHDIRKKSKEADASKASYVTQIKGEIASSGLSISDLFTPNEVVEGYDFKMLFTPDELRTEIMNAKYGIKDLFSPEAIKALTGKKKTDSDKEEDSSASKGEKWLEMEGRAPKYYAGQVYSKMSQKQLKAKDFSKALGPKDMPKNWLDKDSLAALEKIATPKGKQLFEAKDEKFMAEMNDLLSAITFHANYIAEKGKKAA